MHGPRIDSAWRGGGCRSWQNPAILRSQGPRGPAHSCGGGGGGRGVPCGRRHPAIHRRDRRHEGTLERNLCRALQHLADSLRHRPGCAFWYAFSSCACTSCHMGQMTMTMSPIGRTGQVCCRLPLPLFCPGPIGNANGREAPGNLPYSGPSSPCVGKLKKEPLFLPQTMPKYRINKTTRHPAQAESLPYARVSLQQNNAPPERLSRSCLLDPKPKAGTLAHSTVGARTEPQTTQLVSCSAVIKEPDRNWSHGEVQAKVPAQSPKEPVHRLQRHLGYTEQRPRTGLSDVWHPPYSTSPRTSKRVPFCSFATQEGKQVSSYFRQFLFSTCALPKK